MNYLLTILSSGRPVYLERTLHWYGRFLNPKPASVFVFDDGGTLDHDWLGDRIEAAWPGAEWLVQGSARRLGQCVAQAECWAVAADSDHEWVWHVEDDVVLLRPLDLRDLAAVLDAESAVPQMALIRCPWGNEIEWGGYISQFPGHYDRRVTTALVTVGGVERAEPRAFEWIATRRNWAHAPMLCRTQLCRDYVFPARPGCETEIGPMLLAAGYEAFGLWGWGSPDVAHIGVERAPRSHGY